ncbi:di-trans,poly-cis-decaprenylcistransferase [marine bacterium AO1-C]|nr:di-trans,poly-cis-decaprenylcistransferase [marine bacterium AO1-C]
MKEKINSENLPQHIAIIMDGNGRWAKKKGAVRVFGHKSAVKAVRDVTEASAELGIKYLTLYAFSTENWSRPKKEVEALMKLLVSTIRKEVKTLTKNNVKLKAIGNTEDLPKICQKELKEAEVITKDNTGLTLTLALSYSGRWDIINAVKSIALDVKSGKVEPNNIDSSLFSKYLSTDQMPDPELMIRTSGEMRVSNFLLWQLAYSEIYISPILWPDFRREHLYEAIVDYQTRERRFGKTSEQVNLLNN